MQFFTTPLALAIASGLLTSSATGVQVETTYNPQYTYDYSKSDQDADKKDSTPTLYDRIHDAGRTFAGSKIDALTFISGRKLIEDMM